MCKRVVVYFCVYILFPYRRFCGRRAFGNRPNRSLKKSEGVLKEKNIEKILVKGIFGVEREIFRKRERKYTKAIATGKLRSTFGGRWMVQTRRTPALRSTSVGR